MSNVAALYAAFAAQPRPAAIEACPHCRDPAEFAPILTSPLHLLADELVGRFLSCSGTVGTAADRQWLAPRVIELVVTGQSRHLDVEQTLRALAHADWATWPAAQRAAVLDVLGAFWETTLATYPAPYRAGDLLGGLSALGPVAPYLAVWPLSEPSAAQHLRDLIADNANAIIGGRGSGEVFDWLRSPALAEAVVSTAAAVTDPVVTAALDEVDVYLFACFG